MIIKRNKNTKKAIKREKYKINHGKILNTYAKKVS